MGSEGRGEQILKTDQDNALLLRDGLTPPAAPTWPRASTPRWLKPRLPAPARRHHADQPLWRQPPARSRTLRQWLYGHDPDGPMNLAIFDAAAVAGDDALLAEARDHLDTHAAGQRSTWPRFAAPADQFHDPRQLVAGLTKAATSQPLDLKKLGTFPIVHGVRALALRHHAQLSAPRSACGALVSAAASTRWRATC